MTAWKWLIVVLIATLCPTVVRAEFLTGRDLKGRLDLWKVTLRQSPTEMQDGSLGAGYVMGLFDYWQGASVCAPSQISVARVIDTVLDFVNGHPESLSWPAASVTFKSLQQAYPCPVRTVDIPTPTRPAVEAPRPVSRKPKAKPPEQSPF